MTSVMAGKLDWTGLKTTAQDNRLDADAETVACGILIRSHKILTAD